MTDNNNTPKTNKEKINELYEIREGINKLWKEKGDALIEKMKSSIDFLEGRLDSTRAYEKLEQRLSDNEGKFVNYQIYAAERFVEAGQTTRDVNDLVVYNQFLTRDLSNLENWTMTFASSVIERLDQSKVSLLQNNSNFSKESNSSLVSLPTTKHEEVYKLREGIYKKDDESTEERINLIIFSKEQALSFESCPEATSKVYEKGKDNIVKVSGCIQSDIVNICNGEVRDPVVANGQDITYDSFKMEIKQFSGLDACFLQQE